MSTKKSILAIVAVLILVSCSTNTPTANPTSTSTTTLVRLPTFSFSPGQFYFSIDGKQDLFFSRNIVGLQPGDYTTILNSSEAGGTQVVRFGFENNDVMGGVPYTNTGELNEPVVSNIEDLLDEAEAHGIYALMWFISWGELNPARNWGINPLNDANGGPAQNPTDVFQEGTPANTMWFEFVNRLVTRWQYRDNILAWEVLGEANLIQGITEKQAIAFVEKMAEVIHAADPRHRPITASLAGFATMASFGGWSNFFSSDSIDFINFHPYPVSGKLDSTIITEARYMLAKYGKPVLIGESGLSAAPPGIADGKLTVAPNARTGIQHAIWAGVVSGSMNARALWWEDSYGLAFQALGMSWVQTYANVEAPVARFLEGVDMSGFKPIDARISDKIFGAALGNENLIIGWFRDAASEPPNWNVQTIPAEQTITLTIPGGTANWQVDFYDTKTGTDLISSATATRTGSGVTVNLPDFTDDIAFKMTAQPGASATLPVETPTVLVAASTSPIAGTWSGRISNAAGTFSTAITLDIQPDCLPSTTCGMYSTPEVGCSGTLLLSEINSETFVFIEQNSSGGTTCLPGGYESLQLLPDGTLSFQYSSTPGAAALSTGILTRP